MNNYKFFVFVGFFMLACSVISCKKYLDTVPDDFLTPSQYYQTEGELQNALTGIYDVLGSANVYQNTYWATLSSSNDIDYWRNNRTETTNPLYYNQIPSDALVTGTWNALYQGINRANELLAAVDESPVDTSIKTPVKAQAQFLRGYFYFLLVSNWGAIPLRLQPTRSVDDANLAKSSIADVYAQVLKDMTEAETFLPTLEEAGSDAGVRVIKTVAEGILARVCLTMAGEPLKDLSKFVDAKNWASKVISSGKHSLNPDYRQIFINHSADILEPKESMWEVGFYITSTNANEWGNLGSFNGIQFSNIDYGYCYGTYGITKKFWDLVSAISPTDLRRDWNLSPFRLSGPSTGLTGISKVYLSQTTANIWARWPGKWRREFENYSPKIKYGTPANFPILRYADVLLMYAEAENELNGPTDSAYWAINQIRERAQGTGNRITGFIVENGGAGYTSAPTVTLNSPVLGNTILTSATVTNGQVSVVNMSNIINGYFTGQPTITFSGGGGDGAVASAILSPIDPSVADVPRSQSQSTFRQLVRDERAVELSQEALRKHDLIRWGILVETMKALSASIRSNASVLASYQFEAIPGDNVSSKDVFLPIPLTELTLNKALGGVNNPGY
ncbi:Starch-binding associating with outer membrane [bacterium A37T11]|nr:Starch-binding associating with outer membrane [bacterium A37T11]